jgi:hypothetical protein
MPTEDVQDRAQDMLRQQITSHVDQPDQLPGR